MPNPESLEGQLFSDAFQDTITRTATRPPNTLWCAVNRPSVAGVTPEEPTPVVVTYYELLDIKRPDGRVELPSLSRFYAQSGIYRWEKTTVTAGDSHAESLYQTIPQNYGTEKRYPPATSWHGVNHATVPRVCSLFSRLSEREFELEQVTDGMAVWFETDAAQEPSVQQSISHAVANIITKSFDFTDYTRESQVVTSLGRTNEATEGRLAPYVSRALGKILIHTITGSYSAKHTASIDGEGVARAVTVFDGAGLITDNFWIDFGVQAGGAIETPEVLPLLESKLEGEDGARIIQTVPDNQRLIRLFITTLLKGYQADTGRHQSNVSKLLKAICSPRQENVDLGLLISVSNSLSRQLNSQQGAQYGEDYQLAPLDPADLMNVSDALLRVLHVTRPFDAPVEQHIAQFEQDVMYADIVGLLREGATHRQAMHIGHVAVAFPGSSAEQISLLQARLIGGTRLSEALRSIYETHASTEMP